jgi:isopenicillin N synthase-like dioxygenase
MQTFALGLGAEETYFDSIVTAPYVSIILQHYPPRPAGSADVDRIGAHSDFESMLFMTSPARPISLTWQC